MRGIIDMTKLHELLAAEKTPTSAWNEIYEDTKKKFKNPTNYFDGYSRSLSMIEDNSANVVIEQQAREEKPVVTSVYETLEYALEIYAKAENIQYQKNLTNQSAVGTVMWKGIPFLEEIPVDELLGLEARLMRIRQLLLDTPTLDASKHWERCDQGKYIWEVKYPEETTKTEKQIIPIVLAAATDKHPAQVQAVNKDIVVGKFTTIKRSGACTSLQKANALKCIDDFMVEIKAARMRANETQIKVGKIADKITSLILDNFK